MNRVPRQKKNTIEVRWAKERGSSLDWWAAWGEGVGKGDARLCLEGLKGLGNELIARGFDPSTLRFSVQKVSK